MNYIFLQGITSPGIIRTCLLVLPMVEKSKAYTFDLMEHQKDSIIRYYLNSFV